MENVKQKVIDRLNKLGAVQFHKPTVAQLRGSRPMFSRVQRQEDRLYRQRIEKQKKNFQLKLAKVQKYLSDIQVEEKRRFDLLAAYEKDMSLLNNSENGESLIQAPVFQPINVVVPKPVIDIQTMPFQRKTRLHSKRRLMI